MQPNQTQLDPGVVNLTKAIRQTESGGNFQATGASGEYGAYQFTAPTWSKLAGKYLGDSSIPLQSATPEQQNQVAYKQIADWKNSGYNVGQIASMWNAGEGEPNAYQGTFSNGKPSVGTNSYGVSYSVPDYAKSVLSAYQTLKAGGQVGADPNNPSSTAAPQPNPSGAWFPSSPTDSPLTAGLKTAGNLIPSGINFLKGAFNMINPLSTLDKLSQIPGAAESALQANNGNVGQTIQNTVSSVPGAAVNALVPKAAQQLATGDISGAEASVTNDPVGQIAPFLLGAEGGAEALDKYAGGNASAADSIVQNGGTFNMGPGGVAENPGLYSGTLDTAISKTAAPIAAPLASLAEGGLGLLGGIAKSAASHVTGLDPTTISQILASPEAFSKLAQDQVSRGGLANEFGGAIDTLDQTLQETGKGYEPIRTMEGQASVPEDFIPSVLDKFGLKLDTDGKVIADSTSLTRNTSDIKAIQKFVDDWGNKTTLSPQEFLNMRSDLAELANYDKLTGMGKTAKSATIADQLRQEANRTIRPQIPGLKELDNEYAPRIQQFKQIKKDFLQGDGQGGYTFKDNAINKIANASGVGKANLLGRMEEVLPGITKKIQILKAVEDIERAKGIKVGTYTKGAIEGLALAGPAGIGPGAVVAAIISNPSIATHLIRGLGWSGARIAPVLGALKMVAGDVNTTKGGVGLPIATAISTNQQDRQK